jgi:hypothetical protein
LLAVGAGSGRNSLASVYALMKGCAQNRVPGPDTEIEIEACDECNNFVNARAIAERIRKAAATVGESSAGRRHAQTILTRTYAAPLR